MKYTVADLLEDLRDLPLDAEVSRDINPYVLFNVDLGNNPSDIIVYTWDDSDNVHEWEDARR